MRLKLDSFLCPIIFVSPYHQCLSMQKPVNCYGNEWGMCRDKCKAMPEPFH